MSNLTLTNPFAAYAEIPPVAQMTGYEMKTTYWGDFRVCGLDRSAIEDTYKRACLMAKEDKVYGTELALVLNWLCWFYAEGGEEETGRVYQKLWEDLDGYIMENWKGEDLNYYIRTTD